MMAFPVVVLVCPSIMLPIKHQINLGWSDGLRELNCSSWTGVGFSAMPVSTDPDNIFQCEDLC